MSRSHECGVEHLCGSRTPRCWPRGPEEGHEVFSCHRGVARHQRGDDVVTECFDKVEKAQPATDRTHLLLKGLRPRHRTAFTSCTPQVRVAWVGLPHQTCQLLHPAVDDLLNELCCGAILLPA